jgi:hypothetical protein
MKTNETVAASTTTTTTTTTTNKLKIIFHRVKLG